MPRHLNRKKICEACRLNFQGEPVANIAILLDVKPNTIGRWRKTQIWKDFEDKLVDEWHQQTNTHNTRN